MHKKHIVHAGVDKDVLVYDVGIVGNVGIVDNVDI